MFKIGLVGGFSYISTLYYYKTINVLVNQSQGHQHSANLVLVSPDFNILCEALERDDWQEVKQLISTAIDELEKTGCNLIIICCNTVHHVFNDVIKNRRSKIIHILEPVIEKIQEKTIQTVGILATKFTLSSQIYCEYITQAGINLILPRTDLIEEINRVILEEMCHGFLTIEGKKTMLQATDWFRTQGCEGLILGCTELGQFLDTAEFYQNIFNSSRLHAEKTASLYCHDFNILT